VDRRNSRFHDDESPCGPGAIPLFPSVPHFPTFYSIFSYLYFSLFFFLLASSIFLFFILSLSLRIVSLRFHAGCRKRRLNLALVFCVDFVSDFVRGLHCVRPARQPSYPCSRLSRQVSKAEGFPRPNGWPGEDCQLP